MEENVSVLAQRHWQTEFLQLLNSCGVARPFHLSRVLFLSVVFLFDFRQKVCVALVKYLYGRNHTCLIRSSSPPWAHSTEDDGGEMKEANRKCARLSVSHTSCSEICLRNRCKRKDSEEKGGSEHGKGGWKRNSTLRLIRGSKPSVYKLNIISILHTI